jgi:hypothetical protein
MVCGLRDGRSTPATRHKKRGPGTPMPPYWLQHEPGPQIQATASILLSMGVPIGGQIGTPIWHEPLASALHAIQFSHPLRSHHRQRSFDASELKTQHQGEGIPRRYLTTDSVEAPGRPTYCALCALRRPRSRRFFWDLLKSRAHVACHRSCGAPPLERRQPKRRITSLPL